MITTTTDVCSGCGNDGIPDTELAAVQKTGGQLGPSWFGVCETCADKDGVQLELAYKLAELRAGTLFGWWQHRHFYSEADKDDE